MTNPLGKLEYVDPREQWPDEAADFTPWVAGEGLSLLGKTIGADLVTVKREAGVGPFRADVLAQMDGEEEHYVVIENQLERTNHDHLGKVIAYGSGLGARTVVWIAREFTDEHRQALDWLNGMEGNVSFFGLEIQLLRIGDSPCAPIFRVVSSPNTWTKAVRATEREDLTETKVEQQTFWQELAEFMRTENTFLSLQTPRPQHWYVIALGRSGFHISLTVHSRLNRVGCELYMSGATAKRAFDLLHDQRDSVEAELGMSLDWKRLDNRIASRIAVFRDGSISDVLQRDELMKWLHGTAERFHKVFAPRVAALNLGTEDEADA